MLLQFPWSPWLSALPLLGCLSALFPPLDTVIKAVFIWTWSGPTFLPYASSLKWGTLPTPVLRAPLAAALRANSGRRRYLRKAQSPFKHQLMTELVPPDNIPFNHSSQPQSPSSRPWPCPQGHPGFLLPWHPSILPWVETSPAFSN
jgi:hypothetical protein